MKRGPILALAAVAVVALMALAVKRAVDARRPQGTDAEQIRQLLYDGERAAERRDSATLNRLISQDYDDGYFNAARVRYTITDYLRRQQAVEITVPSELIVVDVAPDGRAATARFRVQFARQADGGSFYHDLDMTLHLQKEPVYYYVIFPGEEWRITRAGGWEALEY
jgi:hypothetical protein